MHELAISNSILELVVGEAQQAGAKKVKDISLIFGELCGFAPEAVRVCLEALCKNTIAEGATVSFDIHKALAHCPHCIKDFEVSEYGWLCPYCHQGVLEIIRGRELRLDSIEVE
jgi:hydrogenase nickel incorporation protein HypA/HybF